MARHWAEEQLENTLIVRFSKKTDRDFARLGKCTYYLYVGTLIREREVPLWGSGSGAAGHSFATVGPVEYPLGTLTQVRAAECALAEAGLSEARVWVKGAAESIAYVTTGRVAASRSSARYITRY